MSTDNDKQPEDGCGCCEHPNTIGHVTKYRQYGKGQLDEDWDWLCDYCAYSTRSQRNQHMVGTLGGMLNELEQRLADNLVIEEWSDSHDAWVPSHRLRVRGGLS